MTAPAANDGARRALLAPDMMLGFMAVCLFVYICQIAKGIMVPFVIAVFLWYLINAIARFLGRFEPVGRGPLPRYARVGISIALICCVLFLVSHLVRGNIDEVIRQAPQLQESFRKIVADGAQMLHVQRVPTLKDMVDELASHLDIGLVLRSFAGMLTNIAGQMVIVVFFVAFFLYEQRFFARKLNRMIHDPRREAHVRAVFRAIDGKVQRYIGVKAFVSAVDSTLTFMILSFYDVQFAGFWGVMAFFLHFIPYAGSFVALTMPVVIALIQFGDLATCVMVFATLCVSHAFLGHILDPYLMGNTLNLSPIFIISNLAMWGMIWGVPGMFLAIPILAIVALTLAQFERTRPLAVLVSKTGEIAPAVVSPEGGKN
jgi:predicted PurR-regulated permease PerM